MLLRWDLFFFFLFLVGEICLQPCILQAENLSDDLNLGELEHQRYQKIQQKQNAQKKRNEVFGKERGVLKHLQEIEIFIDKELSRFKYIYAAAGHPNCIFKIDFDNLIKITKGSVKNITE